MSQNFSLPEEGQYLKQLGFENNPFPVVPDANDYFVTPALQVLIYELLFAVSERKGFAVVTGEVGLGKSTLSRFLIKRFENEAISYAMIFNSSLQEEDLLDAIMHDFELPIVEGSIQDKLEQFNKFLLLQTAQGRNCVLIVDDAQNLSVKSLETLRLLSNLETEQKKLIQILLVGQGELNDTLNSNELRQLKSRINVYRQLQPLNKDEHRAYIAYKLGQSSGVKPQLNTAAFKAVYRYTGGNLRQTNLILDRVLISLVGSSDVKVDGRRIHLAAQDCGFEKNLGLLQPAAIAAGVIVISSAAVALLYLDVVSDNKGAVAETVAITNTPAQVDTETLGNEAAESLPKVESTPATDAAAAQPDSRFAIRPAMAEAALADAATVNSDSAASRESTELPRYSEDLVAFFLRNGLPEFEPLLDSLDIDAARPAYVDLGDGRVLSMHDSRGFVSASSVPSFSMESLGQNYFHLMIWQKRLGGDVFPGGKMFYGRRSQDVADLQAVLAQFGLYDGEVDGVVGGQTYRALYHFQKEHGLETTGLVDGDTFLALHFPDLFVEAVDVNEG